MRLMAILVDNCGSLKGGALASALHMHGQHGDPFVHAFIGQLLEKVSRLRVVKALPSQLPCEQLCPSTGHSYKRGCS
jgi:hypothetical protein